MTAFDSSGGGATTAASTSFTVNITSAATGAHVFMWVAWGLQNATFTPPTGWRQILVGGPASTLTCGLFYHKKAAGETTFNFTVGSAKGSHGWVSYTGLDDWVPYQVASSSNFLAKSSASTSVNTPSVVNSDATAWALGFFAHRSSTSGNKVITWTNSTLTERVDQNNSAATSSIWTGVEIADSNGTVTAAAHSYTAVASFSETFGGGALIYLMPTGSYLGPKMVTSPETSLTTTASPKTLTAVGALANDLVVAMFGGDDFTTPATAATTSTTAGSTGAWTEVLESFPATETSPWKSNAWANVTADGDVTASLARTQGTAQVWGGWLAHIRDHGGIGNVAELVDSTSDSVSLTVSEGSMVLAFAVDWDHISPVTAFTPDGAIDVERNAGLTAVSWYAGYWINQSAGTRNYGIATNSSSHLSLTVIEVLKSSGVTAVGKSLQTIWNTRAAVGDPLQLAWGVRTAIGDNLQLPWNVRAALGKTLQGIWNTRAVAGASAQLLWNTRALVGDDLQLIWNVQFGVTTAVGKDLGLVWNSRALAGASSQLVWSTRSVIGKPLQALWSLRSVVGDPLDLRWGVRLNMPASLALQWSVRQTLGDPLDLRWGVRTFTGKSLSMLWNTRAAIGEDLQLIWDVDSIIPMTAVGKDLSLAWSVRQALGDPLVLRWNTRAAIGDVLSLAWAVRAALGKNLSIVWNTRAVVSDTIDLRWGVRTTVGVDGEYLWAIRVTAGKALALVWNTEGVAFSPIIGPYSSIKTNGSIATIISNGRTITRPNRSGGSVLNPATTKVKPNDAEATPT